MKMKLNPEALNLRQINQAVRYSAVGKKDHAINVYFVYEVNGTTVYEDVKGRKTDVYAIKKKLFEYKFKTTIKET